MLKHQHDIKSNIKTQRITRKGRLWLPNRTNFRKSSRRRVIVGVVGVVVGVVGVVGAVGVIGVVGVVGVVGETLFVRKVRRSSWTSLQ